MKKRPVAVFDIDGTIFRSSLFLELVDALVEAGIFPHVAREEYLREQARWLNRMGDYETYVMKAVASFKKHIKGVPFDAADAIGAAVLRNKKNRVYRYTRDLVRKLKKKGYFLLAISHSPRFVEDLFSLEFGFDKAYGFFWETGANGRFTGKVNDENLMKSKAGILRRAVRKEGLTLAGSVGVGDTESDISMLELVDHPLAFNPNKKLYLHAKKRGWKVVVERKDVIYEL
jgi:HAD superfamily hydrolase (TIGR01490 family)